MRMILSLRGRPLPLAPLAPLAALALGCAAFAAPARAQTDASARDRAGEVAAVLDIAAGEYALAVTPGATIVDSLEYQETRLMLAQARELAGPLLAGDGENARRLQSGLDSARARVERVAAPGELEAALERVHRALYDGWGAASFTPPPAPPSSERGRSAYRAQCSSCHGPDGRGDGPAAASLDPPPTDFTDRAVALDASPARFYKVIGYGIPGTGMKGWRSELTVQARWDLVAYLSRLAFTEGERARGERLYAASCASCHGGVGRGDGPRAAGLERRPPALTELRTLAPLNGRELLDKLAAGHGGAAEAPEDSQALALLAYLRTLPEHGTAARTAAGDVGAVIDRVRGELERARGAHPGGEPAAARRAALQAYMTFEELEPALRVRDPELVRRLESHFLEFRNALERRDAALDAHYASLETGLDAATATLTAAPAPWSDFLQSLAILLREGFEAILIIGALLAFLVKSGNGEYRTAIYAGAGAALAASLLTAVLIELVFQVAPASQELLEGITMLIAVVVLFSVSYWLVSKIEQRRWERYIREKMNRALSRRSQLALASVAFLAVYREGFETVLFYKALLGAAGSEALVGAGFLAGLVGLGAIYLVVFRSGMRIPLRYFFAVTSGILYYMALVFAGKGVRELQEAGAVGVTPVGGVPQLEFLGLYPTLQTLAIQGALILALAAALLWTFVLLPVRSRGELAEGADTGG